MDLKQFVVVSATTVKAAVVNTDAHRAQQMKIRQLTNMPLWLAPINERFGAYVTEKIDSRGPSPDKHFSLSTLANAAAKNGKGIEPFAPSIDEDVPLLLEVLRLAGYKPELKVGHWMQCDCINPLWGCCPNIFIDYAW